MKFTPEMFMTTSPALSRQAAADIAQRLFNEWASKQAVVYGVETAKGGDITWGFAPKWRGNTHRAVVALIERIGDR